MTSQTNLMIDYYSSFLIPNEEDSTKNEQVSGQSKSLKKEYYKLLNRYEQFDTKIHATTKEKAVTAVAMHKLTEAEQTRELIKSRLKQLGNLMLVQQQQSTGMIILNSLEFICETMKSQHRSYSEGLINASKQMEWINDAEEKLTQNKQELEGKQKSIEIRVMELGTDKWFNQIIKKKEKKDEDLSLAKSPVIHITTSKGALDMVKTLLDNHPEYLDMQDPQGWVPLHVACHKGHVDITKELLARGASVNILNDSGDTAMHVACSRGNIECVENLLSHYLVLDNPNKYVFYNIKYFLNFENAVFTKRVPTFFF